MVKVFTTEAVRAADQYTVEHEPISSINLMKRAATRAYDAIWNQLLDKNEPHHFNIFCGMGNNGGDGLVMAAKFVEAGIPVEVYMLKLSETYTEDCKKNLERYKTLGSTLYLLTKENHNFELKEDSIVIDAIFGSGLNRPIEGFTATVIQKINASSNFKIAIDIPSGLFAEDNSNNDFSNVIKANYTLSFQFPKLTFFFPESADYVGFWKIIDIGLHAEFIKSTTPIAYYLQASDYKAMLPKRAMFSHKGSYGHALLLAGSKGKIGASVLAAKACLRSGVGLLTVQSPKVGYAILQSSVPEAMVEVDEEEDFLSTFKMDLSFSAMGIGPGIGQAEETQNLLKLIIQSSNQPMVIDADAINILATNRTWLSFLPKNSILTPHPGEFKRLVGSWENDFERLQLLKEFAVRHGLHIVLKGRYTTIATSDGKLFFNPSGNSGMATGGSGDVLTGIIISFLAQAIAPQEAAILGVFVHGLAGDFAAKEKGKRSMLPSDIIDCLGNAFHAIESGEFI